MLKLQRPLCTELTFRLTHDISPDLYCDEDDHDLDQVSREQFIFSCLAKQRDKKVSIIDKVKDTLTDRKKSSLIDVKLPQSETAEKAEADSLIHECVKEKLYGSSEKEIKLEKLKTPFGVKQKTIEQLHNAINEQYHSKQESASRKPSVTDKYEPELKKSPREEHARPHQATVPKATIAKPVRKPRKLPEIPNKSPDGESTSSVPVNSKCLADELQEAMVRDSRQNSTDDDDDVFYPTPSEGKSSPSSKAYPKFSGKFLEELKTINFNSVSKNTRPYTSSNNVYLEEDSTADSQRHLSVATSSRRRRNSSGGDGSKRKSTSSVASANYTDLEVTHRGMHRFMPRHKDEISVEIGDPIHVFSEADDLWCEGVNMRTFQRGIFPSMYATDLQFLEDDSETDGTSHFNMRFLGSVEVNEHKGDTVLCQAINKIALSRRSAKCSTPPPLCTVEVSQYGIRMFDKSKSGHESESDAYTHFFALKNISFCGFHPRNERYFGFITKHPKAYRFACHVFLGEKSTRSVSEAIGNAFKRFYQEYMAFTHPTEDIYME
ncbi:C-Jun-amino-terminal kinase-interacting protein 1-like [Mizuhopecten yessoensis]|uniref:JNK-interacting protein 1 n=1 Tax=Mizuhopecten yessoensis TaxID=6573 RepID=A0A210QN85_MIZYE|nr:C-Jun-amino-terminal kinase-interacting protein 1-like [Mizuhopecten yessoensis]OWF50200.1 JNK-interacting protein 1 [Mizuhopecten yessoensis]